MIELVCDEALIRYLGICGPDICLSMWEAGEQGQRGEDNLDFCFHSFFWFTTLKFSLGLVIGSIMLPAALASNRLGVWQKTLHAVGKPLSAAGHSPGIFLEAIASLAERARHSCRLSVRRLNTRRNQL